MFTVDAPLDPTAGRRARMIRERPDVPQPITDATDPRYDPEAVLASVEDVEYVGDPVRTPPGLSR